MTRRVSVWRSVIAALALSVAAPAVAQESAEALFKEGVAAAEAGKAEVAYEKLSAAWKLKQTFDIAGNLGVIENALGKHRDAAEHLDFAIRNLPASAEASARADLTAVLDEAKKKIATLQITATAGAAIELDGKSLGNAPLPNDVFVEPGKHALLAKGPAMQDGKLDFEVAAGDSKTVSIELKPVAAPKVVDDSSGRPMWPAYAGFGVAAAGIGVGIAGLVLSAQKSSDTEGLAAAIAASPERCVAEGAQPNAQCEEAVSSFDDSKSFQIMGIAGMSVGGAALAFAVIYMVLPDGSSDEAATPKTAIAPWFGPDGGGFAISSRF